VPAPGVSARWIEKRKPYWDTLEALVAACARRGVAALDRAKLRELALLYRQTAADLSVLRDSPGHADLARYLNALLGRAHNLIYSGQTPHARGIYDFYARVYPAIVRRTLPYTALAFALFVLGMLAGSIVAWADPGFTRLMLGGPMIDTIERGEMWTHSIVGVKPLASSAIAANNLSVTFAAFAGGILAGIGTIYMMLFNGVLIGVVSVACYRAGLAVSLWSFIAPHGALELPAIFIAGGSGLLLAKGLLAPGLLSRRDSLVEAAALAVRLLLGVIPMLIVAGLIEGFISPTAVPVPVKFVLGGSLLILLAGYVVLVPGRPTADSAP
jgi:uncharacterized membrane protein SpoIIM required for sporulation